MFYSQEAATWKHPVPVTEEGADPTDLAKRISEILDCCQSFSTEEGEDIPRVDLRFSHVPRQIAPNVLLAGPEDVLERIRINPIPKKELTGKRVEMALLAPDLEHAVQSFISFQVNTVSGQLEGWVGSREIDEGGEFGSDGMVYDFPLNTALDWGTPTTSIVFVGCYAKTGMRGNLGVYGINYPLDSI